MEKLKALFRNARKTFNDERIWLVVAGMGVMLAVVDAKAGDYLLACGDLAIAGVVGVSAWFGVGNQIAEARG